MSSRDAAPEGAVAASRRLGPAFDLLAAYRADGFLFERAGVGVAGAGVAARIADGGGPGRGSRLARRTLEVLRGIGRADPDALPIAVGALPFDEGRPAELVVPARAVVRRERGRTLEVAVGASASGPADVGPARRAGRATPHEPFREIQLRPEPTPEGYLAIVGEALGRIRAGRLRKVVLARSVLVDAGRVLDPVELARRLRAVDPEHFAFAAPSALGGVLVGASPELLVRRVGRVVESAPLAGSAPRSGDPGEDRALSEALLASAKDREEHAVVVEAVADLLRPFCEELAWDPEPVLLSTANVWHLATRFRGVLRDPPPSALELASALHPTPAVGGAPREEALRTIAELEPFDRGSYAGPVGWMDARGDGEWAIALRCAELVGTRARLYAGAGIVAGSVPELELDETERKFRAFLDSLRWG
ncbi:MAG TPA: isochorismate synthase [Actinomycetota bacterium]|nr:isochorismate synthase [Actinomycetota bacterium]